MRIAVTAYGACNGLGRTTAEVVGNLEAGRRGLSACPLDVPFQTVCGVVADPLEDLPGSADPRPTRQRGIAWLGYQGVAVAVSAAVDRWGPGRVGAVLGTSTGGIAYTEWAFGRWRATGALPADYSLNGHSFHQVGRALRQQGGWRGPTYAISTACSSSAKAFASARRLLRTGRCDAVLVGGVDSLALTTVRGFHSLGASSPGPCRPFSAQRDGMNVGEGAAFVLLERDTPSTVVLSGVGESSDAFHMSAPDPEGRGAREAMLAALQDAGVTTAQIDYINAHGTATERNDAAEARAIFGLFGASVPVVSTKSYTGHLLGAAGATEALFAIVALEQGWIPANLEVAPVDPAVKILLPEERQDVQVRHALSNSLAFGGSNVALVFSKESV